MRHLMTQLPRAYRVAAGLVATRLQKAIFGLAEVVEHALGSEVYSEWKTGEAIGKDAVMDVAAAGVITSQCGGPLPGLTAATRILVVAVRQVLVADEPESLNKECQQKMGRDALREVEAKAAKDSDPVGHHARGQIPV